MINGAPQRGVSHNDFDARHDRGARHARRAWLDGGLLAFLFDAEGVTEYIGLTARKEPE